MKKILLFTTVFLLLFPILSSCAKEESLSVTSAEETSADNEEQKVFRLNELPDIGEYRRVRSNYYYGEPLNSFRASEDYGTVIPYCRMYSMNYISAPGSEMYGQKTGAIKYGFMTTDGRIITAPVYENLRQYAVDGKYLYVAEAYETFTTDSGDEYPEIERPADIINTSGSRFCKAYVSEYPSMISDLPLLAEHASPCDFSDDSQNTLYVDFDAKPILKHLSENDGGYHQINERILYFDEDIAVLDAELKKSDDSSSYTQPSKHKIQVFDRNENLQSSFIIENADSVTSCGKDHVLTSDGHIYDTTGNPVCTLPDTIRNYSSKEYYNGFLYLLDGSTGTLRKVSLNGTVKDTLPDSRLSDHKLIKVFDGTRFCFFAHPVFLTDPNNDSVVVLDEDLRELYSVPVPDENQFGLINRNLSSESFGFFITSSDHTDFYDFSGNIIASCAFQINWAHLDNTDSVLAHGENDDCFIIDDFTGAEAKGYVLSMKKDEILSSLFSSTVIVSDLKTGWEKIISVETGETLVDEISCIDVFKTPEGDFCSYSRSGISYVLNENLETIAAVYDDFYA